MEVTLRINGVERVVHVTHIGGKYTITIDGREIDVKHADWNPPSLGFMVGNESQHAIVSRGPDETSLTLDGVTYQVSFGDDDDASAGPIAVHGSGSLEAPMPGNIVRVDAKVGDTVKAHQPVVILESMKMQNEISAPFDGTVKAINCAVGDQVAYGEVLAEIEKA